LAQIKGKSVREARKMEYGFEMGPQISQEDMRKLKERLAELAQDEQLRVHLDTKDSQQRAALTELLVENGYSYHPAGGTEGRDQYLLVRRLH
jgi:hypothetical protein